MTITTLTTTGKDVWAAAVNLGQTFYDYSFDTMTTVGSNLAGAL